jgi:hypothetical protein
MTPQGLRKMGSGKPSSSGNKTPGAAAIAEQLKIRFQDRGWIS